MCWFQLVVEKETTQDRQLLSPFLIKHWKG